MIFNVNDAVEAYNEWITANKEAAPFESFLAGYRIACEKCDIENVVDSYADSVETY